MRNDVLLLFSGGRDSMLSAVRLIKDGYRVRLISFDNGHMQHPELISDTAIRLVNHFGSEKVAFEGIKSTSAMLYDFLEGFMINGTKHCPPLHCVCLCCHTAMIIYAVKYCIQNDIRYIATGDKESDPYLIDCDFVSTIYNNLCNKYGIKLLYPVANVKSNFVRKVELAESGLHPKTYEPQCWLGYKPTHNVTEKEKDDASELFNIYVLPKIKTRLKEE